jgi:hypothetical protein
MAKVSPALSYLELFRVTGPLLSLVFRTEDVWQRCIETVGALNQGFPFSLLQCRQGRTRMAGWVSQRNCTLQAVTVCGFGTRAIMETPLVGVRTGARHEDGRYTDMIWFRSTRPKGRGWF